ncbi:major facilitator superfamily domain-containing protein [Xylariales sp. PMI_506]|nr:major facilitator superfamily domain-containing protein [Xylariales sp. PMI_506]
MEKTGDADASSRAHSLASSDSDSVSQQEIQAPAEQTAPEAATETENEKTTVLARHTTAQSQQGDALEQTLTREDGVPYPAGLKLFLITLALCLSVFLVALDNSIIATAIPKITDEFHSLTDVGWYGSAYLLTTAALQLLFGKFYTFLSIKWVYLVAIVIFEVGSLICGVAQNSVTLIIGRAVAGLGSAGIFSGALLILAHSVPLVKRPIYSGLIGGMYGIASVAGPLLGGVFTDKVTWRWCFFINLPIGAVTLLVILFFFPDPTLPKPKDETLLERVNRFDPIGTIIFMPAVVCLLLALQWGGTTYAWNSGRIIALFVVFAVLLMVWFFIQYRQKENATVPAHIIKNRTVWSSSMFAFGVGSAFFLLVYYIPVWFQAVQGVSAVNSGIRNLPMLISVVITSIFAGGLVTALGHYAPFMIAGTILMSVGAGLLTTFNPTIPTGHWIGFQIIFGAGVGFGMQQPMMAVQTALDIKDVPTGTSVVVFLQTLGGALFVSVAQNIFTNQLVQSLATDAPDVSSALVLATGATGLKDVIPAEYLAGVILAYSTAITKAFYVSVGLAVFTVFGSVTVPWLSVKGKNIEMAVA